MAIGFIRKMFSFGRKEEADAAGTLPVPAESAGSAASAAQASPPSDEASPPSNEAVVAPRLQPEPEITQEDVPAPTDVTDVPSVPPAVVEPVPPAPETVEPATAAPETRAPETPAPETRAPETPAPETPALVPPVAEPASRRRELKPLDLKARAKPAQPVRAAPPAKEVAPQPIVPPEPIAGQDLAVPASGRLAEATAPAEPAETVAERVESTAPPEAPAQPSPQPAAPKLVVAKEVKAAAPAPVEAPAPPRQSWFQRLKAGLARSSRELSDQITGIFTKRKLDEDTLQDLEDVLIRADLGLETAMRITDTLSSGRYGKEVSGSEVRAVMAAEIEKVLGPVAKPLELDLTHKPHVLLVVGVNGTGKTTTIGKLAAKLVRGGLKVTLAAGDTFRAAAIEQLKIWGERTGSTVVSSRLGADAAGLAFDAYEKAKAEGADVLIIDTAGRLQNKAELMDELAKIVRVLGKIDPEAPHTVLQTLDATTGQNALSQVEIFRNVAGVSGLVMTKLDGTARGGILVAIAAKHKLPVYFIGVGEQIDDLEPFEAKEFAQAIAGSGMEEG
ncbi:MAG: signal recognition particle-docking protein FtsY [Rhizobiaceae bacterium]|jgi:fused signal recognition particle receptor|nr:signal recognition particle-docking protein FtsY [Rhizobiaceae bacterium]